MGLEFDGVNGIIKNSTSDGDVTIKGNDGGSEISALTFDISDQGTATFNHDVKLGDSSELVFGAGNDLKIYHDGSNSYITDVGTGGLYLKANADFVVQSQGSDENMIYGASNAFVKLYHNGSEKLATASGGVDVTGTVTSDGASLDGAVVINEASADVDFRVESNSNTHMLFVNAGAEAVCVGTSSGTGLLNVIAADGVKDADYVVKIENQEATGGRSFGLNLAAGSSGSDIALNINDHDSANNLMRLFGNGTTAFPVTTAFGIGTDSPGATFHVDNSSGGVIRVSRNSASTSNYIAIESDGTNGTVKAIQELIISAGGGEVARFTSGGLAIGGTGAANTLDDYEEGTFSPSLSGASGAPSGVNYSIRTGSYTKIGRLVTCHIYLALSSWSSGPSGDGIITALPFTVRNDNDSYAAANIAYADGFISSDAPQTGYAVINTTKINLQTNQSSDSRDDLRTPVNAGNFSGDETIIITCSYHTDS